MFAIRSYSVVNGEKNCGKIMPGSIGYILGEHRLDDLGHFLLHSDLASLHMVCNVGVHPGPADDSSCKVLHFFNTFVAVM